MDPVTAICNMITEAIKLFEKIIDGQPPEVRAELWKMHLENIKNIQAFWQPIIDSFKGGVTK